MMRYFAHLVEVWLRIHILGRDRKALPKLAKSLSQHLILAPGPKVEACVLPQLGLRLSFLIHQAPMVFGHGRAS